MPDAFRRFLLMSEPEALSLYSQAELGEVRPPERSQFAHLVRHFLERFFNHETASPDGDAKSRLVLIAFAAGLPGFVVALYLWPVYHPVRGWPSGNPSDGGPPPYWVQVNHHFFYVIYSFVVMGIVTVFEWDMFFPDRLDLFVLQALPIAARTMFMARVSAIATLIGGFLFDANLLAPLALPAAIDPPDIFGFLAGHLLAVACSGLFAVAFLLALQGLLISFLGERLFCKLSLPLQGFIISALLVLLLLFPVLSGAVPVLLQSGSAYARYFPPFWFLGMYQRLFEGPTAHPVYSKLAQTGFVALVLTAAIAFLTYPSRMCAGREDSSKVSNRGMVATGRAVRLLACCMQPSCGALRFAPSITSSAKACCAFPAIESTLFSMAAWALPLFAQQLFG